VSITHVTHIHTWNATTVAWSSLPGGVLANAECVEVLAGLSVDKSLCRGGAAWGEPCEAAPPPLPPPPLLVYGGGARPAAIAARRST
jgi:hypothetical protein